MNSRGPKENRFLPKRKEEETNSRKNVSLTVEIWRKIFIGNSQSLFETFIIIERMRSPMVRVLLQEPEQTKPVFGKTKLWIASAPLLSNFFPSNNYIILVCYMKPGRLRL